MDEIAIVASYRRTYFGGGRHLGDRPYFPAQVEDATGVYQADVDEGLDTAASPVVLSVEVQVLEAFIAQHYIDVPVPPGARPAIGNMPDEAMIAADRAADAPYR